MGFGLESGKQDVAEQLTFDYRTADLDAPDRALCDYAAKLTITPGACGPDDLDVLRQHGFDDEQIAAATQVISYFNYINRIADGLGVDPEPFMTLSREDWHARKASDYVASQD